MLDDDRRYPSTIGGAFYLLVLAGAASGIAVVWAVDWRLGVRVVAASLIAAALLRLVLPPRDAGMLTVRHRVVDVLLLGAVAAALIVLRPPSPTSRSESLARRAGADGCAARGVVEAHCCRQQGGMWRALHRGARVDPSVQALGRAPRALGLRAGAADQRG